MSNAAPGQAAPAPITQPKQPRFWESRWGDVTAWWQKQKAKTTKEGDQGDGLTISEELDRLERFKLSFARGWFILAALFLAGVAGWSVGYTFSGLHPFSLGDQETLAAYAGSFALEGISSPGVSSSSPSTASAGADGHCYSAGQLAWRVSVCWPSSRVMRPCIKPVASRFQTAR